MKLAITSKVLNFGIIFLKTLTQITISNTNRFKELYLQASNLSPNLQHITRFRRRNYRFWWWRIRTATFGTTESSARASNTTCTCNGIYKYQLSSLNLILDFNTYLYFDVTFVSKRFTPRIFDYPVRHGITSPSNSKNSMVYSILGEPKEINILLIYTFQLYSYSEAGILIQIQFLNIIAGGMDSGFLAFSIFILYPNFFLIQFSIS